MLTDKNTVLVACANVPKDMGSEPGGQAAVDDRTQNEFRNHLRDWLAGMTDAAGVASLVPEIAPTPTKTESDDGRDGTTNADASRRPGQVVAGKI